MSMNRLMITQIYDRQVEIGPPGAAIVYRHEPTLPKACLHPLTTLAGVVLSGFEMSDHIWHRGLWFTIKLINGTNYWEEHAPFGVQIGQAQPRVELLGPETVRLNHSVQWTSDATGPVLQEQRTLTFQTQADVRLLDWTGTLRASQDLLLDRTPFTTWGGYGGLSFRASRELHDVRFDVPGETVAALTGQPHPWCLMQAAVDGGPGRRVAFGMIDHPANPRAPSPWYCKSVNGFTFMNAAFLFHEPMMLAAGQTLALRYRVAWRDGQWDAAAFAELAETFRQG